MDWQALHLAVILALQISNSPNPLQRVINLPTRASVIVQIASISWDDLARVEARQGSPRRGDAGVFSVTNRLM